MIGSSENQASFQSEYNQLVMNIAVFAKSKAFAPIADRISALASDFDFDGILKLADQWLDS
jgi:hypothetical protein